MADQCVRRAVLGLFPVKGEGAAEGDYWNIDDRAGSRQLVYTKARITKRQLTPRRRLRASEPWPIRRRLATPHIPYDPPERTRWPAAPPEAAD